MRAEGQQHVHVLHMMCMDTMTITEIGVKSQKCCFPKHMTVRA